MFWRALVLGLCLGAHSAAAAEDYLLRWEILEFTSNVLLEPEMEIPEENYKLRLVLETLARPDQPFTVHVVDGARSHTLAGKLQQIKDDKCSVSFRFREAIDTGTVLDDGHGKQKVFDESVLTTQLTVELGKPLQVGGSQTSKTDTDDTTSCATRMRLTISPRVGVVDETGIPTVSK